MSAYKTYVVSYRFQGADWGTTIVATSMQEAKARIEQVGAFGRIDGELMATIPVGGGPLVKMWGVLANFFRSKP